MAASSAASTSPSASMISGSPFMSSSWLSPPADSTDESRAA
jgi:hypothetical protein